MPPIEAQKETLHRQDGLGTGGLPVLRTVIKRLAALELVPAPFQRILRQLRRFVGDELSVVQFSASHGAALCSPMRLYHAGRAIRQVDLISCRQCTLVRAGGYSSPRVQMQVLATDHLAPQRDWSVRP